MDPADLIAAHTEGAGEALAAAIKRGEGPKVEPLPSAVSEARDEQSRADQVGELLKGFKRLKRGWK